MTTITLDSRELNETLAALRFTQAHTARGNDLPPEITDIATNGDTEDPLALEEIDALCERINVGGEAAPLPTIPACIANAMRPDISMDDAIRPIQDLLGVADGDLAGVMFSDLTPHEWEAMSYERRELMLMDYVTTEIAMMRDAVSEAVNRAG